MTNNQEIDLLNKTIELMAEAYDYNSFQSVGTKKIIKRFKQQAQEEMKGE